jgi:hypothetical protein
MLTRMAKSSVLLSLVAGLVAVAGIYQYFEFNRVELGATQVWFFLNVMLAVVTIASICMVSDR